MGKVEVVIGEKVDFSYQKKRWREWCMLHHKEENGVIKIHVENTSFTGGDGCEVDWKITLTKDIALNIAQDAGSIVGSGAFNDLKIDLAAGSLKWKDSNNPLAIKVAAGNVVFENAKFPNSGSSSIDVATGNISLTSPSDSLVKTSMKTALGSNINEFESSKGHNLSIKVALGKASHKKI